MTTILTIQEPDPADTFNGSGRILGMVFTVDTTAEIVALRFWAVASGAPTAVTVGLWDDDTATWLTTEDASGPFAEGWNEVTLTTPVELSTGTTYGVGYWKSSGNVAGLAGLHSNPISNGPFTAPTDASRFRNTNTGPPAADPPDPASAGNFGFFADVSTGTATPADGAAAFGVGLGLVATGARPSAGVTGYGLGVEMAVSGARDSTGVGEFVTGLAMAAVGSRTGAGTVEPGLGLGLAASGARPSQGSAAFTLGLALAGSTVIVAPTPAGRTATVPAEARNLIVPAETRTQTIPEERRLVTVR